LVEIEFSEGEDFMIFRKLFAVLLLCSAASVFAAEAETVTNYDSLKAVSDSLNAAAKEQMQSSLKEAASAISKAKLGVDITDTNEAKKGVSVSVSVGEAPFVALKRGREALAATTLPFPLKGTPEKPKVLMYVNPELQTASKKVKGKMVYKLYYQTYELGAGRFVRDEGDYMSLFKAAYSFRVMQSLISAAFPDIKLSDEMGKADGANPLDSLLLVYFSQNVLDKLNMEVRTFIDGYATASGPKAIYKSHKALEEVMKEVKISEEGKRSEEVIIAAARRDMKRIPFPIVGGKFVNKDLQAVLTLMETNGDGLLSAVKALMNSYEKEKDALRKSLDSYSSTDSDSKVIKGLAEFSNSMLDQTNKSRLIKISQNFNELVDMLQLYSAEKNKKCIELDLTAGNPAGLNPFGNLLFAFFGAECSQLAIKSAPGIEPWMQKTIIGFTKTRVLGVKHYYSVLKCAKIEASEEDAKMMKDAEKDAK
jgi:hypothetical protein